MAIHQEHLERIFYTALSAVHPAKLVPEFLRIDDEKMIIGDHQYLAGHFRNIFVGGAGKASGAMAAAVEKLLGNRITDGIIAVKKGHAVPLEFIRTIEAGHPLPDYNSVHAASQLLQLIKKAGGKDLFLFLLSGGASSLITDLPEGIELRELDKTFQLLVNSGASIQEMNTVRKHLSGIKGGQLIQHSNSATVISFILSDVIGNDLAVIGSGPTVGDPSSFEDAAAVLHKYELTERVSVSINNHIKKGIQGSITETPNPGNPLFALTSNYIIGDQAIALKAAAAEALNLGYQPHILTDFMSGDTEQAALQWVKEIEKYKSSGKYCLIGGGETTVQVTGNGKGGRNQHFALAAAILLQDRPGIILLAAGTDGTDGPTDAAGAVVTGESYAQALTLELSPENYLKNHDSYHFFMLAGGLLKTGPTQTNVMDLVITLIG